MDFISKNWFSIFSMDFVCKILKEIESTKNEKKKLIYKKVFVFFFNKKIYLK